MSLTPLALRGPFRVVGEGGGAEAALSLTLLNQQIPYSVAEIECRSYDCVSTHTYQLQWVLHQCPRQAKTMALCRFLSHRLIKTDSSAVTRKQGNCTQTPVFLSRTLRYAACQCACMNVCSRMPPRGHTMLTWLGVQLIARPRAE